jgi:hypothetical protein
LAEYSQTDSSPAETLPNQRTGWFCIDRLSWQPLPDISNNVGPVKHFLKTLLSFYLKEVFLFRFLLLSLFPASTTTARL